MTVGSTAGPGDIRHQKKGRSDTQQPRVALLAWVASRPTPVARPVLPSARGHGATEHAVWLSESLHTGAAGRGRSNTVALIPWSLPPDRMDAERAAPPPGSIPPYSSHPPDSRGIACVVHSLRRHRRSTRGRSACWGRSTTARKDIAHLRLSPGSFALPPR